MARKRMISPEIWESESFSELTDCAKIVFISLFSHADDEGRGRADTSLIKSMTFPYDENRRVADIKSALSEIARSMSVQFYNVNGKEYYFMTSWKKWQKVDKPSPSKLPPPPTVGVGGDMRSQQKFGEHSTNDRRMLDEDSATNRIERNIIPPIPPKGEAWEKAKEEFLKLYPKICPRGDDSFIDYSKLKEAFSCSKWLQKTFSFKWVREHYNEIVRGAYADEGSGKGAADERSERERYYALRRNRALAVADAAVALARQDPLFADAESEIKRGEIALARAEVYSPDSLPAVKEQLGNARQKRADALVRLRLSEEDFLPKFSCKKCSDTGFMKNGKLCDCYRP